MSSSPDALTAAIEPLPAQQGEPAYQRLNHADIAKILRLHDEDLTQAQIAQAVGVHVSTISRCLANFEDTSDLAKRRLKASANRSAERVIDIVENGKNDDALKAAKVVLEVSDVLSTSSGQPVVNVGIVLGVQGWSPPARDQVSVTIDEGTK